MLTHGLLFPHSHLPLHDRDPVPWTRPPPPLPPIPPAQLQRATAHVNGQVVTIGEKLNHVERKLWAVSSPFETSVFEYKRSQQQQQLEAGDEGEGAE